MAKHTHPYPDRPISSNIDYRLIRTLTPLVRLLKQHHNYYVVGMDKIPPTGRLLVCVNHSLATYDILLLGYSIYAATGRLPRGLGDRKLFGNEFFADLIDKIGVVEANPLYAQELLERDKVVIVAPGGMREALRPSTEKHQVLWEKRQGFIRLAMQTQSSIILAACPKADELYDVDESWLTKLMYKQFKLPIVNAKGIRGGLLPKQTNLIHFLSNPLKPPKMPEDINEQETVVQGFHRQVVERMQWMLDIYKDIE